MGTSREVVSRLRWDARFDAARFAIGFREGDGVRETRVDAWDGTVPWHRVLYVTRDDGLVVWDRDRGLDLVSSGEALQGAPGSAVDVDDGFEPVPAHRWTGEGWVPVSPDEAAVGEPAATPGPLRVAFWNVLSDRHDPEVTSLEPRLPALLESLRAQDADVLALVEVTRRTLAALLETPWLRAGYLVSDVTGATLGPEGPLLLSRRPLSLRLRAFDNGKRALVGRLRGPGGPLILAVVHLTSDQARDAARKRAQELAAVASHLLRRRDDHDALLVGDLNARDDDPGGLAGQGFVDVWRALHPADPGYTFDPTRNALAARKSARLLPARFDRLLLRPREAGASLEASRVERFGAPSASDHEGLVVDLDRPAQLTCAPSRRAALALRPPADL